jgi:hypothetical protein
VFRWRTINIVVCRNRKLHPLNFSEIWTKEVQRAQTKSHLRSVKTMFPFEGRDWLILT